MNDHLHHIFENPQWLHRKVDEECYKECSCTTQLIHRAESFICTCDYFKSLLIVEQSWDCHFVDGICLQSFTRLFAYEKVWVNYLYLEYVRLAPD